tara:strand:+ start:335 stop:592 length:258 start_codon:yes stop_codon:yes gene_type:complete
MIINAIKKINPEAEVVVRGEDIDTCEIEFHNGTAEISRADIKAMIPVVEQELKDAETKKINDKATAKSKLKALGLTDAEVEALQG